MSGFGNDTTNYGFGGDDLARNMAGVDMGHSLPEPNSVHGNPANGKAFGSDSHYRKNSMEADPTGKSQHEPGAKLDQDKLLPALVLDGFAPALAEVVKVGTFGAIKYTKNGWKEVPNAVERYTEAGARHSLAISCQGPHSQDDQTTISHLAHKIWNDLAVLTKLLESGMAPASTSRVIEAAKKLAQPK